MRQLILQMGTSMDGMVAAPDGSHPWGDGPEDPAAKIWKLKSPVGPRRGSPVATSPTRSRLSSVTRARPDRSRWRVVCS